MLQSRVLKEKDVLHWFFFVWVIRVHYQFVSFEPAMVPPCSPDVKTWDLI